MQTELLTYQNDTGGETRRAFIRDGIAGNYDVVFEMVRVIRNSNKDYRLKNLTAELLKERHLDSYKTGEQLLRVIFNYVKENVSYIQDMAGSVESVKSAYRTLFDKFGDCDDMTVTLCSMAGVIGFENVNIALAKYSKDETSFSHVYAVIYGRNGERFALDTSLPNAEFNRELKPYEVKEINVFESVAGIDGISGIWQNTQYLGKKLAGAAMTALPSAVNFLPLGFVSGAALSTGAGLLNSQKRNKSLNETATAINKQLDKIINQLINNQIALDLAQSNAAQYVSQLSLVKDVSNVDDYKTIRASIEEKFLFIKDFERIAAQYGYKVTYLNSNAMLLLGAGAGAYGVYKLFQLVKRGYE